ncbi:MAG: shikimate dehydrogenase family protein [Gaiellaceae bacterium]
MIAGSARVVALLGQPVAHSLSPRMQNAAFAARGLDYIYVPFDVPSERIEEAVRGLVALGFAGANVTAPHKLAVAKLCETDVASVNTLLVREGRLEGRSTDAAILDGVVAERPAVIGGGGSATAFAEALPHARVFSRSGDWPPRVDGADLVIHATTVKDEVLVRLGPCQTLIDLPYPASATAAAAREAGATVLDGLDVLVAQGAASFELWTGVPAPVDVMRAAVGLRP